MEQKLSFKIRLFFCIVHRSTVASQAANWLQSFQPCLTIENICTSLMQGLLTIVESRIVWSREVSLAV